MNDNFPCKCGRCRIPMTLIDITEDDWAHYKCPKCEMEWLKNLKV